MVTRYTEIEHRPAEAEVEALAAARETNAAELVAAAEAHALALAALDDKHKDDIQRRNELAGERQTAANSASFKVGLYKLNAVDP